MIEPRKHPYLIASVAAIIFAVVVWFIVPKEYAAQIKIADEYKETDLAVGLNDIGAKMREMMGTANQGINDIEVYCKVLKTDGFIREIANIRVPDINKSYGEYLSVKDTINEIKKHLEYNLSTKKQTVSIQFTDKDPFVAACMLDSVVTRLQFFITSSRREVYDAELKNADIKRKEAALKYNKAQRKYAEYLDAHNDESTVEGIQYKAMLEKNRSEALRLYRTAVEQYFRFVALKERVNMSFAVIKANKVPTHYSTNIIGYIFSFLILALIFVKTIMLYKKNKDKIIFEIGSITSPWMLTILVWGVILLALLFRNPDLLNAPNEQFYMSLFIWLILFCLFSWGTHTLMAESPSSNHYMETVSLTRQNKIIFNSFFILSLIITPLYLKRNIDTVLMFGTEDLMANIRVLAVSGYEKVNILNYSLVINETLLIVALRVYPNIKLWKIIVICITNLLNAFAIMEKGGILFLFFCIVFVLYERGKIKIRSILVLFVAVFLFFYIFTVFRSSTDAGGSEQMTIFDFIAMYVLSPPVAFCEVKPELEPQFGGHTI